MKKIYIKINCKGKRTVGKTNKGIHVRKNTIGLKKLKIKIINKRKEKKKEEERKKRKENSTELQKPSVAAEVYNNNKNVTEYTHIHIYP